MDAFTFQTICMVILLSIYNEENLQTLETSKNLVNVRRYPNILAQFHSQNIISILEFNDFYQKQYHMFSDKKVTIATLTFLRLN